MTNENKVQTNKIEILKNLADVEKVQVGENRRLNSATHEEIISGATTDIYFVKSQEILHHMGKDEQIVVAEIFCRQEGMLCGMDEALALLQDADVKIWALPEGSMIEPKEVVMRIEGKYSEFGVYETALLGILASSTGWATAAYNLTKGMDKPMSCFGARHIHPAIAPVMERAAVLGGCSSSSCILGAKLLGQEPAGTTPHALFLTVGNTLDGAKAYDEIMPADAARVFLVDTFKDEVEEALALCEALGDKLQGIRLDTPKERGGVTVGLVQEMRARLDMAGYQHVSIFVSGGLTPERIVALAAAGADAFGVGSYISGAPAIDMTMDLKMVDGKIIAKRGRIPGMVENLKLVQVK